MVLTGCGSDEAVAPEPAPVVGSADVAAFLELVYQVDSAVAVYSGSLADPALTQELCRAANATYDREARAAISRMLGQADELDDLMLEHGGEFHTDMSCTARAMMAALDSHHNVACMWADIERDRGEATAHLAIMMRYVDHAEKRSQEMLAGMAGAGWNWSPLAGCYD